jgi:hypothetical protein
MLKCKQLQQQASEYIDKDCSIYMRIQIKMHLMLCGHCSSFIKKLKLTKSAIAAVAPEPANSKQVAQVMNKLEHEHSEKEV